MAEANAEQSDSWNAQTGESWVRCQADLDTMNRGALELLVSAAAPRSSERVIDVGCGAGAGAFALARAVAPGGDVLGVDVSAPLLERAEERRRLDGIRAVAFRRADAQDHPFEPGARDLVASRFGVMFFADPVAAFANLARGLRPGGRIAFVAWDALEHNPWFAWPDRVAHRHLGLTPPEPSDAPGPMAFRDVGRVVGFLGAAGFRHGQGESVAIDLHHPDGLEAVGRLLDRIGPLARLLRTAEVDPGRRTALIEAVLAEFEPLDGADGIRIPARVNLFTAERA